MKKSVQSKKNNTKSLTVVGIGASAGGLDALQKVLPGLPSNAGISYVIVQHLAPRYRSMLDSLLTKHTRLAIKIIKDGDRIKPDTLFITPPSKDVGLSGDRLMLSQASDIGPKPSIDYFFSSLAEAKGIHAVGIILSGTGTDGAHGIRAIKSNDGITIAQSAETAKFDGMPRAAVDTGSVDLILPPEKIGPELESALKYPHMVAQEPKPGRQSDEIKQILDLLNKRLSVDFSDYKSSTIYRRISRRVVLHKLGSLQDYLDFVTENPEELDKLYKDLLISVTGFFRDPKAFDALSVALKKKVKEKSPGDPIRIWVPACASGEEAYSIAILMFDILGHDIEKYRIQIFATDIDEDSVNLARKSTYPLATLMDTDGSRFESYFTHVDNTVTVNKAVRDLVVLAKQDLLKNTPFLHLDLISCRNLLIYLNPALQNKLLSLFHYSLDPRGLLFLGKSESVNQKTDLFKPVNAKWKIYQKRQTLINRVPQLVQRHQSAQIAKFASSPQSLEKTELWKEREFASSLLDVLDCSAIMTDSFGNILYIRGDVSDYLKLPQGSVKDTLNAVSMARSEFRYILQSLLHRAKKEKRNVTSQEIQIQDKNEDKAVRLKVGPVRETSEEQYYLIIFYRLDISRLNQGTDSLSDDDGKTRINDLEQELEVTREHLQDTLEELETSGEELQSLNEELQSANEELQASNEELETSNEELQASNEELNTVNQELRVKSDELTATLGDLETSEKKYRLLVEHMNEALMMCEIEYGPKNRPVDVIILQVNRTMKQLLDIRSSEMPVRASIAHLPELAGREILETLADVSKDGSPATIEQRFETLDKDLFLSVYHLDSGRLGVVCRDDTQRNKAREKLKESEARAQHNLTELETIYNNAPIGLCLLDPQMRFLKINRYLAHQNGTGIEDHIGKTVAQMVPDLADQVEKIADRIHETGNAVLDVEIAGKSRSARGKVWMEQWLPIKDKEGNICAINVVVQDISDRKRMERMLQDHAAELERIVHERTAELEATIEALKNEIHTRRQAEEKSRKLSRVFMDSVNPIIIESLDGKIVDVNNAAVTSYGFSRKQLIGKSFMTLVPDDQREFNRKLRRDCLKGRRIENLETTARTAYNQIIPVLVNAFTVKDPSDAPEALVTIVSDISIRKKLETSLRHRREQLGRLTTELTLVEQRERKRLAAMLHDHLQQLLVGTKMKLETVSRRIQTTDYPEIPAALDLTVQAVETSRTLSAEMSPPVLFSQGLIQALSWLAEVLKKRYDFHVELALDHAIEVAQDALKILLYESIRETLFNAVKHSGVQKAELRAYQEADWLVFEIQDHGRGFDVDLFWDEKAANPKSFGLLNIKERINHIGGILDIKSRIDKGTTLTIKSPTHSERIGNDDDWRFDQKSS